MAWWDGWIKPAINIGAGVLGGAVGSLLGPAGTVAGATLGYSLASGIQDSLQAQSDAQTQQTFAQDAANQAQAQADLAKTQQSMAWEQSRRQLAAEAAQRDVQVSQTNSSARKAAIDAYQAESAGQAALATSGAGVGSTPYAALEASSNENLRSMRDWWSNAAKTIQISEQQGIATNQNAQMNWQASGLQQASLLTQKTQHDWQASKYAEQASTATLVGNIAGSALNAVSSAFSMYSSLGALDIAAKKGGFDGLSLGNILETAPQAKYAQMSGDYSYFQPQQSPPALQTGMTGFSGMMADRTSFAIPPSPQMADPFEIWKPLAIENPLRRQASRNGSPLSLLAGAN